MKESKSGDGSDVLLPDFVVLQSAFISKQQLFENGLNHNFMELNCHQNIANNMSL